MTKSTSKKKPVNLNQKRDEDFKGLEKYFEDLVKRSEKYKEAAPFILAQLKSGKLDEKETSGVIPAVVAKKVKQVEFVKAPPTPKAPKLPELPKRPAQPSYTTPDEKANQEKFAKSKKKFDKKIAKAFSTWLVTDEDDLHKADF
jgi:hypothetical protein